MSTALPQEMQQHTYAIMDRVEDSHWWFVGRRAILETFLRQIVQSLKSEIENPRILDVGCGTGANLEMLSQFGSAEGVDVSDEAVEKMLEDSLEHAFEDVNDRIFVEAKMKAGELLPAVRRALEQVGDQLDTAERAHIAQRVAEVEQAIAVGAAQPLKRANAALDEATQRLATLLIERAMRS